VFGGSGLVKEGRGLLVERLFRNITFFSIPGGAETTLLDGAAREVIKSAAKL